MYEILKKNIDKTKYSILFTSIIIFSLLLLVVYKNDVGIKNKEVNIDVQKEDLIPIKNFLLTLIKSPFINIDYEIKSGDSIQKILKKFLLLQ